MREPELRREREIDREVTRRLPDEEPAFTDGGLIAVLRLERLTDRLSDEARTLVALLPVEKRDRMLTLLEGGVDGKLERVRLEREIRRLLYDLGSGERARLSDRIEAVDFRRVAE